MDVLEESIEEVQVATQRVPRILSEAIPWELIAVTLDLLRRLEHDNQVDAFAAIPSGWYALDRAKDGELIRQMVPLYSH